MLTDPRKFARFTNWIALIGVILMVYWVFVFFASLVFGFTVFAENISQSIGYSIVGILAIIAGSVILNVMFNLTAIAESRAPDRNSPDTSGQRSKWVLWAVMLSFPLILGVLYTGDHLSANKKRDHLISVAQSLVSENQSIVNELGDYEFGIEYASKARQLLKVLGGIDENFPAVSVILNDEVVGKELSLVFRSNCCTDKDDIRKEDYLYGTSRQERSYLARAYSKTYLEPLFSANGKRYELYFPVDTPNRIIVLHFSDYSRYGKFGS